MRLVRFEELSIDQLPCGAFYTMGVAYLGPPKKGPEHDEIAFINAMRKHFKLPALSEEKEAIHKIFKWIEGQVDDFLHITRMLDQSFLVGNKSGFSEYIRIKDAEIIINKIKIGLGDPDSGTKVREVLIDNYHKWLVLSLVHNTVNREIPLEQFTEFLLGSIKQLGDKNKKKTKVYEGLQRLMEMKKMETPNDI
jgi:hypothetical protein